MPVALEHHHAVRKRIVAVLGEKRGGRRLGLLDHRGLHFAPLRIDRGQLLGQFRGARGIVGDKAFDADWLRVELDSRGAAAVIPPKSNRKATISYDKDMYRWRHLIENFFAKLKEFRAIATRYDKTDSSFRANIHLAAAIIAAR